MARNRQIKPAQRRAEGPLCACRSMGLPFPVRRLKQRITGDYAIGLNAPALAHLTDCKLNQQRDLSPEFAGTVGTSGPSETRRCGDRETDPPSDEP